MLIMPCIYAVSPKSSKNPEIFLNAQFGQYGRWRVGGQGQPTKDRAIGKPKPRKAGPRSRNGGGGAGLGFGTGVPRLGLCPRPLQDIQGHVLTLPEDSPTKDGLLLKARPWMWQGCWAAASECSLGSPPCVANTQPGHAGAGRVGEDTGPWPDSAGLPEPQDRPCCLASPRMSSPGSSFNPPMLGCRPSLCSVFLC